MTSTKLEYLSSKFQTSIFGGVQNVEISQRQKHLRGRIPGIEIDVLLVVAQPKAHRLIITTKPNNSGASRDTWKHLFPGKTNSENDLDFFHVPTRVSMVLRNWVITHIKRLTN